MRQILPASKKSNEGPSFEVDLIAYRSAQHRVARFERFENGALCDRRVNEKLDFSAANHTRQRSQMLWKYNANRVY
jgi:hypothetical protein